MSAIPTYFSDFLSEIRLSDKQLADLRTAHRELRQRLKDDDITKDLLVDSFLQGSYARSTGIKPEAGHKVDVDVVAVTNIDHSTTKAREAFDVVLPFVAKYYSIYEQQSRSIGISLDSVDLDFVITASPSEETKDEIRKANLGFAFTVEDLGIQNSVSKDSSMRSDEKDSLLRFFNSDEKDNGWRSEPLLVPDYDDNEWHRTHPLEQIRWTSSKNQACNGHYINVVRAIKWWKRVNMPNAKYPKSYPLEHFIGFCCPDAIDNVADGIVKTLETIVLKYPTKPFLSDHGVPEHDVFEKLSDDDYNVFYTEVCKAAPIARAAYNAEEVKDSVILWRKFFADCDEFPEYNGRNNTTGGFTPRVEKAEAVPTGRFG